MGKCLDSSKVDDAFNFGADTLTPGVFLCEVLNTRFPEQESDSVTKFQSLHTFFALEIHSKGKML